MLTLICFTVSIATPTMIIIDVPPVEIDVPANAGKIQTIITGIAARTAKYVAPSNVTLNKIVEILTAVCSPGFTDNTLAFCLFKLSATLSGSICKNE